MKFSLLLLLCAVVVLAVADEAEDRAAFAQFQSRHGRNYRSANIAEKKFAVFRKNRAAVLAHNEAFSRGEAEFELAVNAFSDKTHEEMEQENMGAKLPASVQAQFAKHHESSEEGNHTHHVRQSNQFTPIDHRKIYPHVHSQKSCGSCYTFSAALALEVALALKTGTKEIIAEQQFVDCVTSIAPPAGGCQGGWPTNVWDFVNSNRGCALAAHYPYVAVKQSCRAYGGVSRIKSVTYTPVAKTPAAINAALKNGALACALKATSNLQNYRSGALNDPLCSGIASNDINHAVTIVGMLPSLTVVGGWDYIIQNSWDTTWGDMGFVRIPAGKNMCNIEGFCYSVNITYQ